jgi:hypothetical protein
VSLFFLSTCLQLILSHTAVKYACRARRACTCCLTHTLLILDFFTCSARRACTCCLTHTLLILDFFTCSARRACMCCLTAKCLCSTNAASPRAFRLSHALVSNISSKVSKVSSKVACAQRMQSPRGPSACRTHWSVVKSVKLVIQLVKSVSTLLVLNECAASRRDPASSSSFSLSSFAMSSFAMSSGSRPIR